MHLDLTEGAGLRARVAIKDGIERYAMDTRFVAGRRGQRIARDARVLHRRSPPLTLGDAPAESGEEELRRLWARAKGEAMAGPDGEWAGRLALCREAEGGAVGRAEVTDTPSQKWSAVGAARSGHIHRGELRVIRRDGLVCREGDRVGACATKGNG